MSRTKAAKAKTIVPDAKLMSDDTLRMHLNLRHATLKRGGNRTDRQDHALDHYYRGKRLDHIHTRGELPAHGEAPAVAGGSGVR
jgi:hypothetical protein